MRIDSKDSKYGPITNTYVDEYFTNVRDHHELFARLLIFRI